MVDVKVNLDACDFWCFVTDVTVIVPVYNRADWILRCLKSIQSQRGVSLQIHVIDDCSTDGTLEIVRREAGLDPRIRVSRTEANSGSPDAGINFGFQECQTPYVCWIGSDDWYVDPLALYKLVARLEETSSDYVYPNFRIEGDPALIPRGYGVFARSTADSYFERFFRLQIPEIPWNGLWRASFLQALDFPWAIFPGALSSSDTLNGLRVYAQGLQTAQLNEALIGYTFHAGMGSSSIIDKCRSLESKLAYFYQIVPLQAVADLLQKNMQANGCPVESHVRMCVNRHFRNLTYSGLDITDLTICGEALRSIQPKKISKIYNART